MKRNIIAVGALLFFSAVLFSCSDNSDNNPEKGLSLEQSLKEKTVSLTTAVDEITSSKGFDIITMNDPETVAGTTKQGDDTRFSANITLDDVKGVYEYSAAIPAATTETKMGYNSKFEKTGDSENFVVKLPKEKAGNPWKLYMTEDGDSVLVNDFVITTTQYNYSFSAGEGFSFDYLLNSAIEVDSVPAGELFVDWSINNNLNFEYESKFSFIDDYSVGIKFSHGDTVSYAYNLKNGEDVLFKEEMQFTKGDSTNSRAYEYKLAIGIIEIVKNSTSDSYMVYRDGVLEEGAVIEVINNSGESTEADAVFCRKGRDLKITFADDSVVVLSELLGQDTRDKMAEIFSSMYDMYFVNHVVNKVAHEAYYMNQAGS